MIDQEHTHQCRRCKVEFICLGDTGTHGDLACAIFDGYCPDCETVLGIGVEDDARLDAAVAALTTDPH